MVVLICKLRAVTWESFLAELLTFLSLETSLTSFTSQSSMLFLFLLLNQRSYFTLWPFGFFLTMLLFFDLLASTFFTATDIWIDLFLLLKFLRLSLHFITWRIVYPYILNMILDIFLLFFAIIGQLCSVVRISSILHFS